MKVEIKNYESFTDYAEIVSIYGQGCNYETKKGVDGFQVDFDIEATNKNGEKSQFHIVLQSFERTDNIMAYNGYEMSTASKYGCDADESTELEEFMDYEDGIFDEIFEIAETECKNWLESEIN